MGGGGVKGGGSKCRVFRIIQLSSYFDIFSVLGQNRNSAGSVTSEVVLPLVCPESTAYQLHWVPPKSDGFIMFLLYPLHQLAVTLWISSVLV